MSILGFPVATESKELNRRTRTRGRTRGRTRTRSSR